MTTLGDLYTDFSRIDLDDMRGGYARVAQVKTQEYAGFPEYCAFKLMRHEVENEVGLKRFGDEIKILVAITNDKEAPPAIPRIYDSGFVPAQLSQKLHEQELPEPDMEIISTGMDVQRFLEEQSNFLKKESIEWLPYLAVDLAAYDDNLLRQIRQQPAVDLSGLYRLPTGEVIAMAIQLLDVMNYLHSTHYKAYMDWKPEHIFWNGLNRQVKLIDWNVTLPLDSGPGERQNIRDDLRLFCGAVLYVGLTFMDPDYPLKQIGPRPTTKLKSPVLEIQRRYLTEEPDFYQRDASLSDGIKKIIKQGLHPEEGFGSIKELKGSLLEFAQQELGLTEEELTMVSEPSSPYFMALTEMRLAQQQLLQAQQHLMEAVRSKGNVLEFKRLFDVIKRALINFPAS